MAYLSDVIEDEAAGLHTLPPVTVERLADCGPPPLCSSLLGLFLKRLYLFLKRGDGR